MSAMDMTRYPDVSAMDSWIAHLVKMRMELDKIKSIALAPHEFPRDIWKLIVDYAHDDPRIIDELMVNQEQVVVGMDFEYTFDHQGDQPTNLYAGGVIGDLRTKDYVAKYRQLGYEIFEHLLLTDEPKDGLTSESEINNAAEVITRLRKHLYSRIS